MFIFSDLDIGYRHYISEHSGCRNSRTGSIALDEHRIFAVALRCEQYNVIRAFEHIERMMLVYGFKRHLGLAVVHLRHKTPAFVFCFKHLAFLFKSGIEGRQVLPEVFF